MSISYQVIKSIIDKIKKLDNSLHHDVYTILKKYELNSTKNNNGIFFDMEEINLDIIDELNAYLEHSHNSKEIEDVDELIDINTTELCENETLPPEQKPKPVSLLEECQQVVDELKPSTDINVSHILSTLDKEKIANSKKTAINIFSAAKKKYSKPVLSESRCAYRDILSIDIT